MERERFEGAVADVDDAGQDLTESNVRALGMERVTKSRTKKTKTKVTALLERMERRDLSTNARHSRDQQRRRRKRIVTMVSLQ